MSALTNSAFGTRARARVELRLREVDAGEPEALGEPLRLRCAAAAAQLDDARALGQPQEQLVAPLGARIVGDLRLPGLPRVDHRVVARADQLRPRVAHSTSTSSSRAASSARRSASTDVSAVAIT